jgi:hypothetical protein
VIGDTQRRFQPIGLLKLIYGFITSPSKIGKLQISDNTSKLKRKTLAMGTKKAQQLPLNPRINPQSLPLLAIDIALPNQKLPPFNRKQTLPRLNFPNH